MSKLLADCFDPDLGRLIPEAVLQVVNTHFPLGLTADEAALEHRSDDETLEFLIERVKAAYEVKMSHEDPARGEDLERWVILHSIDQLWQEHLFEMDSLRDSISNYRYAQKDPLVEYKHHAYELFVGLMDRIKTEVLGNLFRTTTIRPEDYNRVLRGIQMSRPDVLATEGGAPASSGESGVSARPEIQIPKTPQRRDLPKVGRNDACPCGSGKKFKSCCGK
jgi:preprotein translocase subunit SecA